MEARSKGSEPIYNQLQVMRFSAMSHRCIHLSRLLCTRCEILAHREIVKASSSLKMTDDDWFQVRMCGEMGPDRTAPDFNIPRGFPSVPENMEMK